MIPSSRAQTRVLLGLANILILRRSLGRNGCGVKQRNGIGVNFLHPLCWLASQRCYANGEVMQLRRAIFRPRSVRRALAVLACAVLLYFAAGGSLLHHHTNGPENACHICQSLHAPVLAAAAFDLVAVPELIARYSSLRQHAAPSNSFSLDRASRAPPSA
jgi:hypothetical protein